MIFASATVWGMIPNDNKENWKVVRQQRMIQLSGQPRDINGEIINRRSQSAVDENQIRIDLFELCSGLNERDLSRLERILTFFNPEKMPLLEEMNPYLFDRQKLKQDLWEILSVEDGDACSVWKRLLGENRLDDINIPNVYGDTLLLYAVKKQDPKFVELLLKFPKIDVNALDLNNDSALVIACSRCRPYDSWSEQSDIRNSSEIIKMLIKARGVDFSKKDNDGNTPLLILSKNGVSELVDFMLNNMVQSEDILPFVEKAKGIGIGSSWKWSHFFPIVNKINIVNAKNNKGESPLSVAISTRNSGGETTRILLSHGADLDSENINERLDDAIWAMNIEAVKLLLGKGAKLSETQFDNIKNIILWAEGVKDQWRTYLSPEEYVEQYCARIDQVVSLLKDVLKVTPEEEKEAIYDVSLYAVQKMFEDADREASV